MVFKTTLEIGVVILLILLFFAVLLYPIFGYLLSPTYYLCEKINIGMSQSSAESMFSSFAHNSKYEYFRGELKKGAKMGLQGDGIEVASRFTDIRCGVIFADGVVADKQFYFD